jgi:hypothetical protein
MVARNQVEGIPMKLMVVTIIATVMSMISPVMAQTATGVGIGTGVSSSKSDANAKSNAVAISGQGGRGGNAAATNGPSTVNNSLAVNGGNTPSTQTIRNVPTVFAPGLTAAGLETCLGSFSGGVGVVGTGVSFGSTIPDPGCAARLDARTLWSMGLRKAAIARLCLNGDIYKAMPDVCGYYGSPYQYQQPQRVGFWDGIFGAPRPVAVAPVPVPEAGRGPAIAGGPQEVIVAKTGEHKLCNDYDASKHRCRVWALASR